MKTVNYKEVILTIVVGLLVLFYIFDKNELLYAATIIGMVGLLSDFFASKITWVWLKLAHILGTVNSGILLSLIFFLFLSPIALLMGVLKKIDVLKLKRIATNSAYDERNHTYVKKDLENTW